jgi:hypothetical protein
MVLGIVIGALDFSAIIVIAELSSGWTKTGCC